ncbi:unnamed protein product [Thelazia callipaeda]|uniref:Secreted protein n=1 Tax=Thelazia callipaeda TaxID=103827 RepID=A0A0N5CL66_THECL|nr:unnamed protein product [Thelazia callipaeda]
MIGSFLTVLICCSSIVACYICKLLRDGIRQPICTTSEIVFNNYYNSQCQMSLLQQIYH